jgi:solute carrier family 24 (sodium/potassium/calcium exchanger), member 6
MTLMNNEEGMNLADGTHAPMTLLKLPVVPCPRSHSHHHRPCVLHALLDVLLDVDYPSRMLSTAMAPSIASYRLAFVAFVLIQAVLWSHSRYAALEDTVLNVDSGDLLHTFLRRSLDTTMEAAVSGRECSPLSVPTNEQCSHVRQTCQTAKTFLSIPYAEHYFCASTSTRPFVFLLLIIWLAFLFSTLGISASDFFCPNLATIAERLGLDENVAGVTFLALGNGSPDVFSTFSAMRAGSGALAIGELLGAASFIVSVVVGTMCIIQPFSVEPRSFMRDVGFFAVAVAMLLVILWDERIQAWEAGLLIALYVLYVFVVVIGSWWDKRQFRKKHLESIVRGEYAAEEMPEPYRDERKLFYSPIAYSID